MTNQTRDPGPCDFNVVVKRVIEKMKPAIEKNGAVVTFDPMPSLYADSPSMVVVLGNLISNAIEFRGLDPPRMHISSHHEGDEWVFSVTDNGIGFQPAEAGHIFEVRERSASRSDLSLAICKKIVESHGGRIWAESEPGVGSTFYFTLPEPK